MGELPAEGAGLRVPRKRPPALSDTSHPAILTGMRGSRLKNVVFSLSPCGAGRHPDDRSPIPDEPPPAAGLCASAFCPPCGGLFSVILGLAPGIQLPFGFYAAPFTGFPG